MINGVHAILYTKDAAAARAFFKSVLGLPSVDAGRGWLIFALPPAEVAAHPAENEEKHVLYFMCDDVKKTVAELTKKGVEFTSPVADRGWGLLTSFRIPGGGDIGLYQPKHPIAAKVKSSGSPVRRRAGAAGRAKPRPQRKGRSPRRAR
jgi:predicted enzyme related to lactoylglutathione lyase